LELCCTTLDWTRQASIPWHELDEFELVTVDSPFPSATATVGVGYFLPSMRSFSSLLVCLFVAAVSALSTSGNRLLVILDDVAEKVNYSKFLADLESV
jgi:hypothetical protein